MLGQQGTIRGFDQGSCLWQVWRGYRCWPVLCGNLYFCSKQISRVATKRQRARTSQGRNHGTDVNNV